MSDLVGKLVAGRYRVDQFIGRGGMADVYKVWDTQRAAFLAMKILHESLADDQVFLRRFKREAQTLAKLKHPNIVRFYELGQDGELVFMLMEFVDGVTLSKARKRINEPFSPGRVLGVFQPVCSALHFAHQINLIHCDIKPANIMIDYTGRVLLTDFGIARVSEGATTATMVGAGTPAYMSPEQVMGDDPTPTTDVYSLGVVLYELLTGGERPFTGENATITGTIGEKIRWEQRKLSPPSPRTYNPAITPELEQVVLRCLSKDPQVRYASVTMLLNALSQAITAQAEPLPVTIFGKEEKTSNPIPPLISRPASPKLKQAYFVTAGLVIVGLLSWFLMGGGITRPTVNPSVQTGLVASLPVFVTQIVEIEITSTPPAIPPTQTRVPPTNSPRPPTLTPVPSLDVLKTHESGGYYLVVTGGPENYDNKYGPLADGYYVVSQNEKFAVYVDILGDVYVVQLENSTLQFIKKIEKNNFQALVVGERPIFSLELNTDDNGTYRVIISEKVYNQNTTVILPRSFTQ